MSVRCALNGGREQDHGVLERLEGVPLERDHDVVARDQLRIIGCRDDPRPAPDQLQDDLARVLVLVSSGPAR
jgi:hypothetical protein